MYNIYIITYNKTVLEISVNYYLRALNISIDYNIL